MPLNVFIAYVAFWASMQNLPAPRVEAKDLPGKLVAQVTHVDYPDGGLRAFGGPVIYADPARIKRASQRELREYALHEMCHLRFATKDHGRDFRYCMAVYEQRAEGK